MNAETTKDVRPKHELYRTARTTGSCAAFDADEFVAIRFSHVCSCHNTVWYDITATSEGKLTQAVAWPAHRLTDFCL